MTDNFRGALFMTLSMAAFTLNDTFMKLAMAELPLYQVMIVRGVLTTVLVGGLCFYFKSYRFDFPRKDWIYIVLRALGEVGASYFFLTALKSLPIANLSAILQLLPLTVTLGAVLVFGEIVGWRRALAICVGFLGMLLIVQPKANGFNEATVFALISVAFVTLRDLSTRKMSKAVPSLFVTLTASASVLAFALIWSLGHAWQPMSMAAWVNITLAGFIVSIGYVLSVLVMRIGDMAHVAFFRYTGLIWALILGFFVFGDWPKPMTLLGATLIVGAGAFTMWRDRVLKQKRAKL